MNRKVIEALFLLFLSGAVTAQDLQDKVLMTVAGKNVPAGEFIRMYRKSYDPANLKDLDSYLDQFVIFKLKVADAEHSGYDTTKAFSTELAGYRNQLAQSYLTDPDTKDKLLKQAYQRSLVELNGWHILVSIPAEAAPDDTAKAYKRALYIKERILQGESFEQVARSSSDDPSVKINGGNLGYFSAFQLIMPFEDAAYGMKTGVISDPVRTPYGYHLIKITDRRPSAGKIKVAHIMISVPPGASDKVAAAAKDTIWMIYRKLVAGGSFSDLAARYSDHKESASKGGELNWFGAGEIVSDFAEAAFRLKKNGDFSVPVKTPYGWHIIKRIDRKPPGTFDEMKPWLESKINDSYLNSISRRSFVEKLKKEYSFELNNQVVTWFRENTDTLIMKGTAKYDRTNLPEGSVYSFAGQHLSARELAQFIEKKGSLINSADPGTFIDRSIETCAADQIMKFENAGLEKKYPDFRYLMTEFHDGILLFDISGKKVWNRSQDDSVGLKEYYEINKQNYLSKPVVEGRMYTLRMKNGMKSLFTAYNKYSRQSDCDSKLYRKFTEKKDTLLSIRSGVWQHGENKIIDGVKWEEGVHEAGTNDLPVLVVILKVKPAAPLPFAEVKTELATGYQEWLEKRWIEQLKASYIVKINRNVFEEIRKKLARE